jgi:hypothetical protein
MLHYKRLLSAALILPAVCAFAAPVEDIAFRVAKGASLTRTFEQETEMSLDNMTVTLNDQDMSGQMGKLEVTAKSKQSVVVKDTILESGDGQPSKLQRMFEKLGSNVSVAMSADNPMIPASDKDMVGKSELEGKTVVFTLDGDEYKKAYAEGSSGDDEILADLWEDMDLRGLLPDGSKKVGDAWDVPTERMKSVLAPGGNLRIEPEMDAEDDMGFGNMGSDSNFADMLGDLEGTVKATFQSIEGEGDAKVAVIKLAFEVKSAKDMSEKAREGIEKMKEKMPEGMEIEVESSDVEVKLKGEGELRWGLNSGHMHSLELSGEMEMALENASKINMMGQNMRQKMNMEMKGSFSSKAAIEG